MVQVLSWPAYSPSTPFGSRDASRASSSVQRASHPRQPPKRTLFQRLPIPYFHQVCYSAYSVMCLIDSTTRAERPRTSTVSYGPAYATRMSILSRRRTSLRVAMRTRWDQLGLWGAGGRLSEMQCRVRAALPARERVYEYVGLESRRRMAQPIILEGLADGDVQPSRS